MAEGAFRKAAEKTGLDCHIDSAGTAGYHIGQPPDPRAIAQAKTNGVNIADHAGRQLQPGDFEKFTHIFALDTANLTGIMAQAPRHARSKVSLLMDAVPGREGDAVKDPYYGDHTDFEEAWDDICLAVNALIARFTA